MKDARSLPPSVRGRRRLVRRPACLPLVAAAVEGAYLRPVEAARLLLRQQEVDILVAADHQVAFQDEPAAFPR